MEAAELNGMRKTDIEHLKSMLSRQVDRARLSYDRAITEQKRNLPSEVAMAIMELPPEFSGVPKSMV